MNTPGRHSGSFASPSGTFYGEGGRKRRRVAIAVLDAELGLGDPDGLDEVVVGQLRVGDPVAVPGQEGRLDASGDRPPAVQEEDFHRWRWPPSPGRLRACGE